MGTLWQDIRYGFRMLSRNPGFSTVVVFVLALGIGANSAIFSVVNTVVLRPLSFPNPNRLVMIWETPSQGFSRHLVSHANYLDWREQNRVFEDMALFAECEGNLIDAEGEGSILRGVAVSSGFFPLLHVKAFLGRGFLPEEDHEGNERVMVLSHTFWQRHFDCDPNVLGQKIL